MLDSRAEANPVALRARAAALLEETRAANARRLAEAQARANAILAEAEATNAAFLRMAEELAERLLNTVVEPAPLPLPPDAWREPAKPALAQTVGGGLELVVGPFTRFTDLARFTRSLRELPGIQAVDTRHFFKGTVSLRVRYEDAIPLATRLVELESFEPHIASATPSRIEVRLMEGSQAILNDRQGALAGERIDAAAAA